MVGVLTELSGEPLQSAREAALRGDPEALERFWGALSFQLLAEQREWSAVLGNVKLLEFGQLNRLGKQT
jgi:hypothetical protein